MRLPTLLVIGEGVSFTLNYYNTIIVKLIDRFIIDRIILQTNDIISIINASVVEVSTQKQITTNHKYQLTLTSETIITPLSDYAESLNDFPNECKFIKGSRLSDLKHGAFVGKLKVSTEQ